VAYGKGLLAYSQPDYEAALTQLELYTGIIADNAEVNYYVELLKKMLGRQTTKAPAGSIATQGSA